MRRSKGRYAARAVACLLVLTPNARAQESPQERSDDSVESTGPTASARRPAAPCWKYLAFSASKPRAELQVLILDEDGHFFWNPVCPAACTTLTLPGARYRVGGRGVPDSREFTVEPGPAPMYVRAKVGLSGARTVGMVMVAVGGTALGLGFLFLGFAEDGFCDTCTGKAVGAFLIGGGLVASGIFMIVSGRTSLDMSPPGVTLAPRFRLGRELRITPEGLLF